MERLAATLLPAFCSERCELLRCIFPATTAGNTKSQKVIEKFTVNHRRAKITRIVTDGLFAVAAVLIPETTRK
jgi:hypothetical protein